MKLIVYLLFLNDKFFQEPLKGTEAPEVRVETRTEISVSQKINDGEVVPVNITETVDVQEPLEPTDDIEVPLNRDELVRAL